MGVHQVAPHEQDAGVSQLVQAGSFHARDVPAYAAGYSSRHAPRPDETDEAHGDIRRVLQGAAHRAVRHGRRRARARFPER